MDSEPHPCEAPDCKMLAEYDDEPFCFTHSPDSGSYVPGYSYKTKHRDDRTKENTMPDHDTMQQEALQLACNIMADLQRDPGMLAHYLDTDDNDGEFLRQRLIILGITPKQDYRVEPI
jgi:hypothetical protein